GTQLRYNRCIGLHNPWQANGEHRALALLACHSNVTTHDATEVPANGKAETGAAVFASGRGVRLGEFPEQPPDLLFGHAESCIGYGNGDPIASIDPLRLRGDGDGAVFSKLIRVAR